MNNPLGDIPVKGYATFDTLKTCMVGDVFPIEKFSHIKEDRVLSPLYYQYDFPEVVRLMKKNKFKKIKRVYTYPVYKNLRNTVSYFYNKPNEKMLIMCTNHYNLLIESGKTHDDAADETCRLEPFCNHPAYRAKLDGLIERKK